MSSVLVNSLSSFIRNQIGDKKVLLAFQKLENTYVDKNVSVLQHTAPSYRLFFSDDKERNPTYKLFNIDAETISNLMKKIPEIDNSWKIMNDSFFILMMLVIRECELVERSKKSPNLKLIQDVKIRAIFFLSFAMYSSLQYKYFSNPPNEDIMNYTINNINNKFLIKQLGSVYATIEHTMLVSHEKYKNDLISTDDVRMLKYVVNLRIRLNNFLKKIKNEYETNRRNKSYLSHEKEDYDPDNYHLNGSLTNDINRIVNKVALSFFTSDSKETIIRKCAKVNECDYRVLSDVVHQIKEKESSKVKDIFSYILEVYLTSPNGSVENLHSTNFAVNSIQVYNKSNTNDERIVKIKEILDFFLKNYCERYAKTHRGETKSNYRRALFYYFILFIQSSI